MSPVCNPPWLSWHPHSNQAQWRWLLVTFYSRLVKGGMGELRCWVVQNWGHGKWIKSDNESVEMTDSCSNTRLWTMQIAREVRKVSDASSLCRQEVESGLNGISHMRRMRAKWMPSALGRRACLIRYPHQALQSSLQLTPFLANCK